MRLPPLTVLALLAVLFAATGCATIPQGRSAIDTVTVHGNHELYSQDITDRLATTATSKFLGLVQGLVYDYSIYDESVLQRDLARVERYYRGRGFLEAHARAARVSKVSRNHVRVDIDVEEGPPTNNREISVAGLDDLPPADAQEVRDAARAALPVDERFDEDTYKKAQEAVRRALTDNGYAYATVKAAAQVDLGTHAIDYQFTVTHGIVAFFGPLTFQGPPEQAKASGRSILNDEVPLRRAVNIRQGAKYSEAQVESATQALLDLGVLSSAHIEPDLSNPQAPVVPLVAKVEPGSLRLLRLGGGLEFDAIKTEIHALVGWEDRDFLGGLRDLNVELKPGVVLYPMRINDLRVRNFLPEERLRVRFQQPGFLEARTIGFVQPELNIYPLLVEPNPVSSQEVPGYFEPKASVGLLRRFGKHLNVTLAYNVQVEEPFQYPGLPANDKNLTGVVLLFPQLVTAIDFRDSAVHPHKGIYIGNDFQVAGFPGSGLPSDIRIQPEVRGYIPLAPGITLGLRATVGFLFDANYGDDYRRDLETVRLSSREACRGPSPPKTCEVEGTAALDSDIQTIYFRGFSSGGPNSNRGYALRESSPYGIVPFLTPATASSQARACTTKITSGPEAGNNQIDPNCSVPIGGFSLWEASVEVRFDISGPLGAATFCDSGGVSANEFDLDFDTLRLSCGAGVRYDTPVGPIRLDVGYRIMPLQNLGYRDENSAHAANPTIGTTSRPLGAPIGINFGIGEAF